jgi:uncharacterized protein (TIGR02246 family)
MKSIRPEYQAAIFVVSVFALAGAVHAAQGSSGGDPLHEIHALNARLDEAGRRMDNDAVMALWADDGVDLLPGMDPMVGKSAIAAWLNGVKGRLGGFTMKLNEAKWRDITLAGDYAFEWCTTHQIIQPPGNAKQAENWGKMVLVLRRSSSGKWLILREAWTPSPAPRT